MVGNSSVEPEDSYPFMTQAYRIYVLEDSAWDYVTSNISDVLEQDKKRARQAEADAKFKQFTGNLKKRPVGARVGSKL